MAFKIAVDILRYFLVLGPSRARSGRSAPMHTLLFLDPGHFHAALTLRVPQARAADEVFVYAREGAELRDFLALVDERRGDVVVLAGKNGGKARTIRRLHESGFHVLADKPWLVEPADLEHVRASLDGWPLVAE